MFLIFPQFCLGRGMMDMAQTWSIEAFAEEIGGGFIGKMGLTCDSILI